MDKILSALPFLAVPVGSEFCGNDNGAAACGVLTVVYYIRLVVKILQIVIPVALILWGTIDMGKAVIAGDEKKMKEAQKPFVKRVISAAIVFLIPLLVSLAINIIPSADGSYKDCWNLANEKPSCMENYDATGGTN